MASTIRVEFVGDTAKLQQAFGQVESRTERLAGRMDQTGKAMTTGLTVPILGAGAAAIKMSSDINELEDRTRDVFGNASGQVIAWSDTLLEKFGIGKDEALDFANVQGNAMLAAGIAQQDVLKLQDQAITRIGDLSSATNASAAEIVEAYASMQRGEYDPMERFVPGISAATVQQKALSMGLAETSEEIDNQDKLQAAHALFLENSANAAGNFARTQGGVANQSRLVRENVEKLGREFGENLLPITQDVLTTANAMLERWRGLTEGQQDLIIKTGGVVAAMGPLLVVGGKVVTSVSAMAKAAKALHASMQTGAISKMVTALGGTGGLVSVAAPAAAGLGVIALAAKGTADDLRSTALAAEAVLDPMADVESNARNLYAVISENKGLTLADIAGPESEQRLKRLADQITQLSETSPQLARELLDLAVAEGDVYRTAEGAYQGHTLFRDEMILSKEQAALLERRVKDLGASEHATGDAAGDLAGETDALGQEMGDTAEEAETLADRIDRLYGTAISASKAQIEFEQSLDDTRKALKENGTTLDTNTEKGRTNRRAVIDLVEKIHDHMGALEADGRTMDQMRPVFNRHVDDFKRTLRQAGFTEEQIKDLIKRYGLVPGKVLTDVDVRGKDKAVQDANAIRDALKGIGSSIASIRGRFRVSVGGSGGIPEATGDVWERLPVIPAGGMQPKVMVTPHRIGGEAGPESYIPLSNDSRRPRAIQLLRRTNELLGDPLIDPTQAPLPLPFARGGTYDSSMWARPEIDKEIKKLLAPALGGGVGYQAMFAAVRKAFPWASLISGFRPGSRTLSGALSWHARGRAIDTNPSQSIARWIRQHYGSRTLELITPWRGLDLYRGRSHYYSAGVHAQHSGGNAHVHWAMGRGGILPLAKGGVYSPGYIRAVRQLLRRVSSGGSFYEDFSYRGMPGYLGRYNDDIADAVYDLLPGGFDFGQRGTRGAVRRALSAHLEDIRPRPARRGGRGGGGRAHSTVRTAGGNVINITVHVHVAGSVRSDRELVDTIRKAVVNAGGTGRLLGITG